MSDGRSAEPLTPLQNAVFLLKQTQAKLAAYERARSEPVAVVGMACRFPGAPDQGAFWQLLCRGADAIRETPAERWHNEDYYDPDPSAAGKMNTRWGGFLDGVDEFDAEFFGISPREAVRVDPQHRLLLEVAWEALEDAGIPPARLSETKTGVYVGVIGNDYALLQARDLNDMDVFSGTGSSHAVLANRLSYVLNLRGPSLTLDTACSSSLVTVDLACRSLRCGETDMAFAAGVNLILGPAMTLALSKAHMMSPDGRCKTFDASADGYVRGEGCGLLVLKRLRDARAHGDRILAVIRGTAVNHDGRSNGLSAPNGPAQEAVLRSALADAGLPPEAIGYIEAHGTGTRLGDPIEIEALLSVLGKARTADSPLMVGSVKTNIGHLESAAGVAGLVKVILMLRHQQIPPHLHLRKINPLLAMAGSPIRIPTELQPWPRREEPLRAGVSSFGFGGTNAHVILEEAPAESPPTNVIERPLHLLTLSARSSEALTHLAGRYADFFEAEPADSLADLAFTSNTGRTSFAYRAAVVADSNAAICRKLRAIQSHTGPAHISSALVERDQVPRVAFLFTGQGAQYAGMGRALYESQPTFRQAIDRCASCLDEMLDRPLLTLLDPQAGETLNQTGYTQPVMFALEYALATLWRSWGVEPVALMGHSVGEFAAACVAGVYTLEDGLKLIAERARLMQALPPGGLMAAVLASPEQLSPFLNRYSEHVAVAAWNGPQNVVISGTDRVVRELLAQLEAEGIKSKTLTTSHAFHSHLMDPVLDPLRELATSLPSQSPSIPIISNLLGQPAGERTYADPVYWARHARSPVCFAAGMQTLAEMGCEVFLEIGPSPVLIGMGQRCLERQGLQWLPSLRPGRDDWQTMLDSLAELYVGGASINWLGFDRDYTRRRTVLPSYPFQKKRYWSKAAELACQAAFSGNGSVSPQLHPLLGHRLVAPVCDQIFESQLAANRPALLADHKIQGTVVMPGAAFFEMALAASAALHGKPWNLREALLLEPQLLGNQHQTMQTILTPDGPQAASFRIVSVRSDSGPEPSFIVHATGRLEAPSVDEPAEIDMAQRRAQFTGEAYDDAWRADALRKSGLEPGPSFCWVTLHWLHERNVLGQLRGARDSDHVPDYQIHPGLLDCGFQLMAAALPGAGTGIDAYVPMAVDRLRLHDRVEEPSWYDTTLRELERDFAVGDIRLVGASGRVLMEIEGLRLRRVPRDWLARLVAEPPPNWAYELAWLRQPTAAEELDVSPVEPGRWLVLDSQDGMGAKLGEFLEMKGQVCLIVDARTSEARRAAVQEFLNDGTSPARGIVYLSALDTGGPPLAAGPDFPAARNHGWGGTLDVVCALGESHGAKPRLWLVTRGAQAVGDVPHPISVAQSPIWGLGRVIAAEHPELSCTRIDLDPQEQELDVEQLAEEIWFGQREDQVAFRSGERFVTRLRHVRRSATGECEIPVGQPYRLEIVSRGQLDQVAIHPVTRQQPGPGQVEIKVRATGLNFRDVLNVLDLYPGDPGPLGGECSGEVVAVGDGVTHCKPGDQVVALAPASFASYVTTLVEFVAPKPAHLSWNEATAIPICFLSAYYALCRLGSLQAGDRVLIHAASGGVGMAAIQLARRVGAEIFATAGSPRKREYLRTLGIEHVMDSRSLDFAEQILQATGGQGIDVVLNSLTGETIASSLSVLRAGGRFLELGKTDLWDQARVDVFRPGVVFHAIALDQMMADTPATVRQLLDEVVPLFESRELVPPPVRAFSIRRVVDALRYMARAEHIGKVVIEAVDVRAESGAVRLREDGTYIVTGGLGGLGLRTARWLANCGARQVVLVGRSAPTEETLELLEAIEHTGTQVTVRRCDVSRREEVADLLVELAHELPPLRGVFHLAGVLDDGILREQTRERFDHVMAAKMLGAWHLHDLTQHLELDQFVLFSSAAAMLGSPGQGNYAAANAFLDGLAHHRHSQQRPALSVNWGSWAEVGMAARLRATQGQRWDEAGIGWIEPDRGLQTLEELLAAGDVQVGVLPVNWPKFFERIPAGAEPPWLRELAVQARKVSGQSTSGPPVLAEQLQRATAAERIELATTFLRQQAAQVLAMDESQLPDARRPLNELGFDSLTGVELCNRVARSIGHHLNPTMLFDYPTLESLAGHVVRDVLQLECGAAAPPNERADSEPPAESAHEATLSAVEAMSDADMEALVTQQLGKLQSGADGSAASPDERDG